MNNPLSHSSQFIQALSAAADKRLAALGINSKIIVQVGSATCERAAGSNLVREEFQKLIKASGRTDILIRDTGCTGRCAREPIVGIFVPGQIPTKYEKVTPKKVQTIFHDHILEGRPVAQLILDKKTDVLYKYVITTCSSQRCEPGSEQKGVGLIRTALETCGVDPGTVRIFNAGCFGLCSKTEVGSQHAMMILPEKAVYRFSTLEDLQAIIKSHIIEGKLHKPLQTHVDYIVEHFFSRYGDVAFFNKQTRLTLRNSGLIDPESLDDYLANKGYEALATVLDRNDPPSVINEILKSGLRGRGGGGYPTGQKWKSALQSSDPIRYVICNADEGDPGAFMDRSALEGDPFIILEGMTIGAFAVGAKKGFIYVRAEYPLAVERLTKAINIARTEGLLGPRIMNSSFDFDVEIRLGAGAFVCGEETALMLSIEGKRGQPRIRPPYPTESGLWGHPTVINNVETWANVPTIMLYGADWYSRIGTKHSRGTKVFALAGKVKNTGLIEVPMGTTLQDIVFDVGGGLAEGRKLKAIQTGGPSGGCIPANKITTPVEYETLAALGSIMGSGGMIILDDTDCMVHTAKFFLQFTQSESCGKCVPCREGTLRMLEILEKICDGRGEMEDLTNLERLARLVKKTSLCGLGQSAPNPILSTIENFKEEFVIHIKEKRCPASQCSNLIRFDIDPDKCTGCTLCARRCPVSCIVGKKKELHVIQQSTCIKCGECFNCCRFNAVRRS